MSDSKSNDGVGTTNDDEGSGLETKLDNILPLDK
jgi:hypothetical protein